jgi:hypothetical protein
VSKAQTRSFPARPDWEGARQRTVLIFPCADRVSYIIRTLPAHPSPTLFPHTVLLLAVPNDDDDDH